MASGVLVGGRRTQGATNAEWASQPNWKIVTSALLEQQKQLGRQKGRGPSGSSPVETRAEAFDA